MHPILFRVPLPHTTLPLLWVLCALAGVAAIVAIYQFVTKNRTIAIGAAIAAAALGGAGFVFRASTVPVGPLPIYSYGVMLGLSLVVGWYLTLGLAERDGLPKELMANNYVVTAVAAVVGSRVLYIVTNLNEFDSFAAMLDVRKGGLVAYGGFLGGFIGSLVFLRRHGIPLLPWADVAVPSLASGLMITRVGCYLFGCDFGQPLEKTAPGWLQKLGTFPRWDPSLIETPSGAPGGSPAWIQHVKKHLIEDDATSSLPVHPTQIYESLVGVTLLVLLLVSRRYQKFRGQIFLIFTFAYGVGRFLLEMLRADDERGWIPPSLPEHILLPLALVLFAVGYVVGISKMIENPTMRRLSQILAFVPAAVLFLALRPESFGTSATIQLSTSQAVALSTGVAAAFAFSVYHQAALAHPEAAMAIPQLAYVDDEAAEKKAASNVADEDEDEEPAAAKKKVADADADADEDEDEAPPVKQKPAKKAQKAAASDEAPKAVATKKTKKKPVEEERTSEPPPSEES
ncbi:prolipoprotein diacylglyceryl transferase family protein [Polyangium sp. 6x1]|uniref:prolipoprotein diacylglyceryl transferase n=1 Tax=Polyangium sp. 6x1 TaxID=3042689 RepID=UPI0024832027|nr:prolipoprotein diacylglyceryl transferase family protein [Polyangium sp. 6x1]MDI1451370.1 prolipoprotein diacylglyceryl transferase [Polyangium sp. 6x1]